MLILTTLAAACTVAAAADTPAAVLSRAKHVLGMDATGAVLRINARDVTSHAFESDRTYAPYLTFVDDHRAWLDVGTGVERDSATGAFGQSSLTVSDDHGVTGPHASWAATENTRALDPRLVVHAWSTSSGVRAVGRCVYRDYPRVVLSRQGLYGEERLFVDPKTGFVTKLDRMEPHYLWGDVHVEYVYSSWLLYGAGGFAKGDVLMPVTATRLVDGVEDVTRSVIDVGRDTTMSVAMPDGQKASTAELPGFLRPTPLDTVRLGPQTFVLANPGYNEIVSLIHDTVFLLDATQSEVRARSDSAWIARLFPGHHPVALIVTDLAWPHVAGLRFWVASGATVISRDMSRAFLASVVARRWRGHTDKLESMHPRPTLRFVPVTQSMVRGDIALYAIDGAGSEGALMAFLPRDGVLWASDYVQTLDAPALYTTEVFAAACRHSLAPTRVVAEHHAVADWSSLVAVVARQRIADYPVSCGAVSTQ